MADATVTLTELDEKQVNDEIYRKYLVEIVAGDYVAGGLALTFPKERTAESALVYGELTMNPAFKAAGTNLYSFGLDDPEAPTKLVITDISAGAGPALVVADHAVAALDASIVARKGILTIKRTV